MSPCVSSTNEEINERDNVAQADFCSDLSNLRAGRKRTLSLLVGKNASCRDDS